MLFETADNGEVICGARSGASVDHNIDGRQIKLVPSKSFTNEPFDAIASHRVADDSSCDRQSKTSRRGAAVAYEYRE